MSDVPPSSAPPAAGWYPHPEHTGHELWWDGTAWSEHTRPVATAPPPPPPAPALKCLVCQGEQFRAEAFMLNTQGMTLLGVDGFNRTASCQVCERCGFIHWFAPRS